MSDASKKMVPSSGWKPRFNENLSGAQPPNSPVYCPKLKRPFKVNWCRFIAVLFVLVFLGVLILITYNCITQKLCIHEFETNKIVKVLGWMCGHLKIFG